MKVNRVQLTLGWAVALGLLVCLYIVLVMVYYCQKRLRAQRQIFDDSDSNNTILEKARNQRQWRARQVLQRLKERPVRSYLVAVRNPFKKNRGSNQPDVSWTVRPRTPVSIYSTQTPQDSEDWPLPRSSNTLPPYQTPILPLPAYHSDSPSPETQALGILRNLRYSSHINIRGLYGLGLDLERGRPISPRSITHHDIEYYLSTSTATTPHSSLCEYSQSRDTPPRSSFESSQDLCLSKWTTSVSRNLDNLMNASTSSSTSRCSSYASSTYSPGLEIHIADKQQKQIKKSFLVDSPSLIKTPQHDQQDNIRPNSIESNTRINRTFTQRSINRYIIAHPLPSPASAMPLPTPLSIKISESELPAQVKPAKLRPCTDFSPSRSVKFSQWI